MSQTIGELEFIDGHIEQVVEYEMLDDNGIFCMTSAGGRYRCISYYYFNPKIEYKCHCKAHQWQQFDTDLCEFFNTDIIKEARIYKTTI